MFTNIANFSNVKDYLPLLNGVLITDLFVILCLNTRLIKSTVLRKWYDQYNLSAVIADVLIIFIGLIIARAIYYYVFDTFSIVQFAGLAVIIQIIHDILFYLFFKSVPRGYNAMFDFFKDYAQEVGFGAILGDSFMMILACLLSSYFATYSLNTNIILLVVSLYLIPYMINYI